MSFPHEYAQLAAERERVQRLARSKPAPRMKWAPVLLAIAMGLPLWLLIRAVMS